MKAVTAIRIQEGNELDIYREEAKRRWGNTEAYREFEEKTTGKTPEEMNAWGDGLMDIFREFGTLRQRSPEGEEAQALVGKLQGFITAHFYTCTKPILRGLGQMYTAGDTMTENIDKAGGEGTASFVHKAIEHYCK